MCELLSEVPHAYLFSIILILLCDCNGRIFLYCFVFVYLFVSFDELVHPLHPLFNLAAGIQIGFVINGIGKDACVFCSSFLMFCSSPHLYYPVYLLSLHI